MRKRILTGLLVGTVVFGAVTGLAASLTVSAGKLGSGSATVTACDTDGVSSTYTFVSGTNTVSAVVVDGIADTNATVGSGSCDNSTVRVEVLNSGGSVLTNGYGTATNAGDADTANDSVSVSLTAAQAADQISSVRVTLH